MTATSIIKTGAFRNRKSSYSSFPKRITHPHQKSWFGDHFPQNSLDHFWKTKDYYTLYLEILREFVVVKKFLGGHWEHLVVDAILILVHIERLKSFISSMNIFISVSLTLIFASIRKVR